MPKRDNVEMTEAEFLAAYDLSDYPTVAVTVDVVVLSILDGELVVLVVERAEHPYLGRLALPGGFVAPDESLDSAAVRELAEETGVAAHLDGDTDGVFIEQLATFGDPGRDPRGRVISVAYVAFVPVPSRDLAAGGDARAARWIPLRDLDERFAFDHGAIVAAAVERVRAKIEWATVAGWFVTEPFTIAELRGVYETVWGAEVHPQNFARKVNATEGFVVATGETHQPVGGGRPARLYRRGPAQVIEPPIRRPAVTDDVTAR